MRLVVESLLPCRADLAWEAVVTSRLLVEVAAPLVAIRPVHGETLPDSWHTGQTVRCRSYLFGVVPLGIRTLFFERVDAADREFQTREADALIRRWDHRMTIAQAGAGRCRYRDEVEIDAGTLTPLVWLFARWFYRHRQRRWRAVARRLEAKASRPVQRA